jgi:ketosteroid isomerase-like protein
MQSTTGDIVSGIMGKWAAAFSRLDAAALASLYSRNAFFFGSNPSFYRGNDGVKAYFEGLPRWQSPSVEFSDVRTAQVTDDVINVAGTASFVVEPGGRSRGWRLEDRKPPRVVEGAADRAVGCGAPRGR